MTDHDEDDEPREFARVEYILADVLRQKVVTYFFPPIGHQIDVACGLLHSLGIQHTVQDGLGILRAPWTSLGLFEEYFDLVEVLLNDEPEDYSRSEIDEDEPAEEEC